MMGLVRFAGVGLVSAALAACAPEAVEGKQDVSEIPSGVVAEAGARDSVSRPIEGGTLRVGQYQEGQFSAARGWIAYDLLLTAGPVDVFAHGQAPGAGDPLDTIVYVFGPRKANGKYPATRLAFNDDADANDVGSHLLLRVPADGTYRIVVSSYDNYMAYPANVTRGDYKVIAKCPRDGGSDACGPAIHYEGGECWADAECASGLHCEGEVTCAPGTQCLWVRPGTCTADYTWMTYAPRQCGANPWQQNAQPGDADPSAATVEEAIAVDNFFESSGIQLFEIGFLHDAVPRVQCLACSCARGDSLVVKASSYDALRLQRDFGFTPVAGGVLLEQQPVQCGGNPWEESGDRWQEERSVVEWATSQGATLARLGFVEKTEPYPVCRACSCPRGDRLVVAPASGDANLAAVSGLGFGDVYKP
jgi:hypothetical protein